MDGPTHPARAEPEVNPFASPLSDEPAQRPPHEGDWEDQRGRGPVAMLFIGGVLGGAVAAFAGAMGAAVLGMFAALFGDELRDSVAFVIFGAFFGGFSGAFTGIACGAILGFVAGFCKARARRWFALCAIGVSTIIGAGVGTLGGLMLADGSINQPAIVTICTGVFCGGTAGALGGWVLSRLLAVMCWGRAPTR